MKIIEVLKLNKEFFQRLLLLGVRLEDCQYVDMYSDYEELRSKKEKTTYIVAYLSEKYNISIRKVYYLINYYESDCKSCAV